mmetsp:Transcript_36812/g.92240  ORF Transcript_36812/g.92240 Transcript_36812/m.92240 type:complete len:89 (-) Transcript_36812:2714-2980(-)
MKKTQTKRTDTHKLKKETWLDTPNQLSVCMYVCLFVCLSLAHSLDPWLDHSLAHSVITRVCRPSRNSLTQAHNTHDEKLRPGRYVGIG